MTGWISAATAAVAAAYTTIAAIAAANRPR